MQKYIFDCRDKLPQSPKYLTRNHKINQLPAVDCSKNYQYINLKNKVFVTIDYSYYQILPKTASMHVGNRMNNLNLLIQHNDINIGQKKNKNIKIKNGTNFAISIGQGSKWKKDKENLYSFGNQDNKKDNLLKNRRKIRMPIKYMPGVGDYYYQSNKIQKRITYDVSIRGKPVGYNSIGKAQPNHQNKDQIKMNQPTKIQLKKQQNQKRNSKSAGNVFALKQRKLQMRQYDEQYAKFMDSINVTNIWKKLMQKHKLKGTKFDSCSYDQ